MMNDQKPLAAQVAAILELRPGASDGDILARVGVLGGTGRSGTAGGSQERKRVK